jgi:hypothetical protein
MAHFMREFAIGYGIRVFVEKSTCLRTYLVDVCWGRAYGVIQRPASLYVLFVLRRCGFGTELPIPPDICFFLLILGEQTQSFLFGLRKRTVKDSDSPGLDSLSIFVHQRTTLPCPFGGKQFVTLIDRIPVNLKKFTLDFKFEVSAWHIGQVSQRY